MASAIPVSEVARNSIWREHVRKEDKIKRPPVPFQLHPKRLAPIPMKVQLQDPRSAHQMDINGDGRISAVEVERYGKAFAALDEMAKMPTAKQSTSFSEAQEVGWMLERPASQRLQRSSSKWNRGRSSCDITSYADSYATMAKCSPFSKSASSGQGGASN
eukprot:FR736195.1.p1 GENE.FR736195.1~~FR736195.1.p1  ORF type:complete len:160 (+),score=7.05 FR736195.1:65-544(+)